MVVVANRSPYVRNMRSYEERVHAPLMEDQKNLNLELMEGG